LNSGFEQLDFLEERIVSLLDKYQEISEKNRALEVSLGYQTDKIQQLEESLKTKDALLVDVESRIDGLLRKFSDFNSTVPDTPSLPVDEQS